MIFFLASVDVHAWLLEYFHITLFTFSYICHNFYSLKCIHILFSSWQFLQDNILSQTPSTLSDPKWVNINFTVSELDLEMYQWAAFTYITKTCVNISPTRFVSEEEMEAKYNRVLSSSILGLGQLIHVTSSNADADMEELFLDVLRQNKFWKYARHKSPNVSVC